MEHDDEGGDVREDVITSLEGLHARLHGDAGGDRTVVVIPPAADPEEAAEHEGFAPVSTLPTQSASEDRLSLLSARLAALDRGLEEVTEQVDRAETGSSSTLWTFEQRVLDELAAQRETFLGVVSAGFDRLESELRAEIRAAAQRISAAEEFAGDDEPA